MLNKLIVPLCAASLAMASFTVSVPAIGEMIQNPVITGTPDAVDAPVPMSPPDPVADYFIYMPSGDPLVLIRDDDADLEDVLMVDSLSPDGNVELFADSEILPPNPILAYPGYTQRTCLEGYFTSGDDYDDGNVKVELCSLLFNDWRIGLPGDLSQAYFDDFVEANGLDLNTLGVCLGGLTGGGPIDLRREGLDAFRKVLYLYADGNISYFNRDSSGRILIGLAGFEDATNLFAVGLSVALDIPLEQAIGALGVCGVSGLQASEVVRLRVKGGKPIFLYGFYATPTGQATEDGFSYSGNYEVTFYCTRTFGYWKTHSIYGPAPYDETWAMVGEDTLFFSSGQTWYEVLWTSPRRGNAYYILAHQYIAAYLNRLAGAPYTPVVSAAIRGAESFFDGKDPLDRDQRRQALAYAKILDEYNNGRTGPGHCDEDDDRDDDDYHDDDDDDDDDDEGQKKGHKKGQKKGHKKD